MSPGAPFLANALLTAAPREARPACRSGADRWPVACCTGGGGSPMANRSRRNVPPNSDQAAQRRRGGRELPDELRIDRSRTPATTRRSVRDHRSKLPIVSSIAIFSTSTTRRASRAPCDGTRHSKIPRRMRRKRIATSKRRARLLPRSGGAIGRSSRMFRSAGGAPARQTVFGPGDARATSCSSLMF